MLYNCNFEIAKFCNSNLQQGINILLMIFIFRTPRCVEILNGIGCNCVPREKFAESPHEYVRDILWSSWAWSLYVHSRLTTPSDFIILTLLSNLHLRRSRPLCLRHSLYKKTSNMHICNFSIKSSPQLNICISKSQAQQLSIILDLSVWVSPLLEHSFSTNRLQTVHISTCMFVGCKSDSTMPSSWYYQSFGRHAL